ncbi:hypothetical protein [Burkholderia phage FLC9]|nr:hypothetical protein [Burkholderia phage FLC9]
MLTIAHLGLFVLIALVALQFSDALGQYVIWSKSMDSASEFMQKVVARFGLAPTIITTKVVIIAVVVALYFLTALPLWLWLAAVAYYLYRSGKWLVVWKLLKKYA